MKYLNKGQIGGFYNSNPDHDNRYYHQFYYSGFLSTDQPHSKCPSLWRV